MSHHALPRLLAALAGALSLASLALGVGGGASAAIPRETPVASRTPAQTPTALPPPAFVITEGSALVAPEFDTADCRPGQPLDRYGKVIDTGALNMFTTYIFDGETPRSQRVFLSDRVWHTPPSSAWVRLTGRCQVDGIDALILEPDARIDATVEAAIPHTCGWVEAHRAAFDFNAYKTTDRFQRALAHLYESLDLNVAKFQPAAEVVFIDADQMIAGIDCGRYVLGETIQRGDYLTLLAIVRLDEERVLHVIVQNTGYFLE